MIILLSISSVLIHFVACFITFLSLFFILHVYFVHFWSLLTTDHFYCLGSFCKFHSFPFQVILFCCHLFVFTFYFSFILFVSIYFGYFTNFINFLIFFSSIFPIITHYINHFGSLSTCFFFFLFLILLSFIFCFLLVLRLFLSVTELWIVWWGQSCCLFLITYWSKVRWRWVFSSGVKGHSSVAVRGWR